VLASGSYSESLHRLTLLRPAKHIAKFIKKI
jgi:hypothetical protein